jgi:TRAP-type C4-dicarboxylate transport system substrate-binding protein
MMKVINRGRRAVMLSLALVVAGLSATACGSRGAGSAASASADASYTIRVATPNPEAGVSSQAALLFKRLVESKSHNKIKVDVYFAGQLGSLASNQTQVGQGSIQMLYISTSYVEPYDADFQALDLPFLFPSINKQAGALDGPAGKALSASLEQKAGIRILGWGTFGFSPLYSTKKLDSLANFKGTTSFSTGAKVSAQFLQDLGMQPTAIDFTEVYTALQQSTLNSVYVSDDTALTDKIVGVAKYRLPWQAVSASLAIEFNNAYFKKLPASLQTVVTDAAEQSATYDRDQVAAQASAELQQLKSQGVITTAVSSAFMSQMQAKVSGVWRTVASQSPQIADIIKQLSSVTGVSLGQ